MIKSEAWDWENVKDMTWSEPSEEAYYLASRWNGGFEGRLLDLGCGIGRHSIFFAEHGFNVEAFDLSADGVSTLKESALRKGLSIGTKLGDMLSLPYEDGHFNYMLAYNVIYHTDRAGIERVISEIRRVLKQDGEIFLTFISKSNSSFDDPSNEVIDWNTIIKRKGLESGIPHYFADEDEIRRLFKEFEIIKFRHFLNLADSGEEKQDWHYSVLAKKI